MKTYILIVSDTDAEYAEGVLRAIVDSGHEPIAVFESRPLPARRRKKKGEEE